MRQNSRPMRTRSITFPLRSREGGYSDLPLVSSSRLDSDQLNAFGRSFGSGLFCFFGSHSHGIISTLSQYQRSVPENYGCNPPIGMDLFSTADDLGPRRRTRSKFDRRTRRRIDRARNRRRPRNLKEWKLY